MWKTLLILISLGLGISKQKLKSGFFVTFSVRDNLNDIIKLLLFSFRGCCRSLNYTHVGISESFLTYLLNIENEMNHACEHVNTEVLQKYILRLRGTQKLRKHFPREKNRISITATTCKKSKGLKLLCEKV